MLFEFSLLIGLVLFVPNEASKYLAEQPKFLIPCTLSESNSNKCYSKNMQVIFKEWSDGVPGLEKLGTLDPLNVKRVKLTQEGSGIISINAILSNLVIKGLRGGVVKDAKVNGNNYDVAVKLLLPKLRVDFDIKAKGRIVALPINGEGKAYMEAENLLMTFVIPTKLRTEGEHVFMDLQSIKLHVNSIDKFFIHTDNLFDQKDLEETANSLLNENWRDFFEVMRPAIEQIIETIILDRFKNIFSYVPSNYFINDLPRS